MLQPLCLCAAAACGCSLGAYKRKGMSVSSDCDRIAFFGKFFAVGTWRWRVAAPARREPGPGTPLLRTPSIHVLLPTRRTVNSRLTSKNSTQQSPIATHIDTNSARLVHESVTTRRLPGRSLRVSGNVKSRAALAPFHCSAGRISHLRRSQWPAGRGASLPSEDGGVLVGESLEDAILLVVRERGHVNDRIDRRLLGAFRSGPGRCSIVRGSC